MRNAWRAHSSSLIPVERQGKGVAEETTFLAGMRAGGRDPVRRGRVVVADLLQDVAREDPQVVLVVEVDALDIAVLREVLVETLETGRDLELLHGDEVMRRGVE